MNFSGWKKLILKGKQKLEKEKVIP